jgi:hypothetical protein
LLSMAVVETVVGKWPELAPAEGNGKKGKGKGNGKSQGKGNGQAGAAPDQAGAGGLADLQV